MLRNFSFLIPDRLAGLARPGATGDLATDLAELRTAGIGALVSLTEVPLDATALQDFGMSWLHLPVPDFTPPEPDQIDRFIEFVDQARREGRATAVHCTAGIGRTGTMLATYLVHEGRSAEEAIAAVRAARPGSIETMQQEAAIHDFASRRAG